MLIQTDLRIQQYQPRTDMAPHDHDEGSMNIVVGGEFMERIGRSERLYRKGHVAFCPAGMTHSQRFGAAGARQIVFKPQDSWLDYLTDEKIQLDHSPHVCSTLLRGLGNKLLEEMRVDDGFSTVAREGILLEIVAAFGRSRSAEGTHPGPPAWLRAARDFIHENAFASASMAQIAQAAGRHEIHLAREFRRFFGVPVGAYVRRLRTEQAGKLLLSPRITISEVAHSCGFANHSHLCREFKAQFGITPSQYRSENTRQALR